MKLWFRILVTVIFSICISLVLVNIENRSNLSSFIIIPLLTMLITKYVLGDWDMGFQWTILDMFYWISIIFTSYSITLLFSKV